MKLARTNDGCAMIGDDDGFVPLQAVDATIDTVEGALSPVAKGELRDFRSAVAEPIPADRLSFGIPLQRLGKLWGIGLNYRDHAGDLDEQWPREPASFLKPSTAATGPGGPIRIPPRKQTEKVTAEAEIGVVIGRECSNVPEDRAADVITGYVPIIDMTAEDILRRNPRFLTRAKSFDSFIVIGPWICTAEDVEALDDTGVRTVINGEVVAENYVRNMQTKPLELVSFHSKVMTLKPGDIISTGTPGAAEIHPGDEVGADIDAVGGVTATVV